MANYNDFYRIIIIALLIMNMILSSVYIYNTRKKENYEYGINLYRNTVNKQYSNFSKNRST